MGIELWAFTAEGEICSFPCNELGNAKEAGEAMVAAGAWKTWDVFEVAPGGSWGNKLLASHHCPRPITKREFPGVLPCLGHE